MNIGSVLTQAAKASPEHTAIIYGDLRRTYREFNARANQLAGQSQGSFAPSGFTAGDMFLNLLLNPYIEGRTGFANSSPPLAYADEPPTAPAANAFSALALGPRSSFEPNLSFWAAGYGGSGTISGNAATGAANTTSQITATNATPTIVARIFLAIAACVSDVAKLTLFGV